MKHGLISGLAGQLNGLTGQLNWLTGQMSWLVGQMNREPCFRGCSQFTYTKSLNIVDRVTMFYALNIRVVLNVRFTY